MKKVYLDNAATTQIRPEVISVISKTMIENYGNPSSSHNFGRGAKNILEICRRSISKLLQVSSPEIVFISGGTEGNNWIIGSAVRDLKIKRIITSKIEHHAVLYCIEKNQKEYNIEVDYVKILPNGKIDLTNLVELLSTNVPTLVSLMHVNNETGVTLDLEQVALICKQYKALFHSDTVQSMGKFNYNLQEVAVDFLVSSAHKFHGPKGVGFAFVRKGILLNPMIVGGEQEKGLRAGTESLHNIVGMTNALEISFENLEIEKQYVLDLKNYCLEQLSIYFPEIKINGTETFHTILNILLPISEQKSTMLLFNLDMQGIAVSRGSACQSGSSKPSHVLTEMLSVEDLKKPSLRISFSHFNTKSDIDYLVEVLKKQ